MEPSLEISVAQVPADSQGGLGRPKDAVNLFIFPARQPIACSQKSRQNKEEVQEVVCYNGRSLNDVKKVKEGSTILTAIPL